MCCVRSGWCWGHLVLLYALWNVVIGCQAFCLAFAGYLHCHHLLIIVRTLETYRK